MKISFFIYLILKIKNTCSFVSQRPLLSGWENTIKLISCSELPDDQVNFLIEIDVEFV